MVALFSMELQRKTFLILSQRVKMTMKSLALLCQEGSLPFAATEAELESAAKGVVLKNTQNNNHWALNNFATWRAAYNTLHSDAPMM